VSHQCAHVSLFIGVVTHGHYNIRNAPVYLRLSLYSHGVITILCDLQIFPCPTNGDVTRVHYAVTPESGTSAALMTIRAIHRHLEASCAEVSFGMIYLRTESPPSDQALS
jgi:hypothetical protein